MAKWLWQTSVWWKVVSPPKACSPSSVPTKPIYQLPDKISKFCSAEFELFMWGLDMPNFSSLAKLGEGKYKWQTDTWRHGIFQQSLYKFLTPPLLSSGGINYIFQKCVSFNNFYSSESDWLCQFHMSTIDFWQCHCCSNDWTWTVGVSRNQN